MAKIIDGKALAAELRASIAEEAKLFEASSGVRPTLAVVLAGKPVAILLLERECTVTVTHILTRDLRQIVRSADIIVVAAGSPALVRGDWVKPSAVVTDEAGKAQIVGDVVTTEMEHAKAVTPVPAGLGPMTVACLLANTMAPARALRHGD